MVRLTKKKGAEGSPLGWARIDLLFNLGPYLNDDGTFSKGGDVILVRIPEAPDVQHEMSSDINRALRDYVVSVITK